MDRREMCCGSPRSMGRPRTTPVTTSCGGGRARGPRRAAGAAGRLGIQDSDGAGDMAVVKFSGADGHELWRRVVGGTFGLSSDIAYALTVDANGDGVASGLTQNVGLGDTFTVIKVSGSDGELLWRYDASGFGLAVAVDAHDD